LAAIDKRHGWAVAQDVDMINEYATRFANRETRMYAIGRLELAARTRWEGHRSFDEHQLVRQQALAVWRLLQQRD
jgi:hypothetical protein